MGAVLTLVRKELSHYFATPVAYVFLVIFLILAMTFTFYFGGFYERREADLLPFFQFHPWLYLFLISAVSMRLWAEELQSGSIELLMTLPISLTQAVLGKFLAAWIFIGVALILTFPIWVTVNYLGEPDNGIVISAYLGSFLMAGAFLAIGSCMSASTKNQVVAFILSVLVCFFFLMSGFPLVLEAFRGWLPQPFMDIIASLSFLTHFTALSKGVVHLRDVVYFVAMIWLWLYLSILVLAYSSRK